MLEEVNSWDWVIYHIAHPSSTRNQMSKWSQRIQALLEVSMNSLLLLLKFLSGRHSVSCSFSSFHTFFSCSFIIISCPLNTLSISFVHHFLAFCFHLYRKELFSSSKKSVVGQKSLHFVVQSDERFPSRSKPDSPSMVPSVWEPQDTPRSSATSSTEPP